MRSAASSVTDTSSTKIALLDDSLGKDRRYSFHIHSQWGN